MILDLTYISRGIWRQSKYYIYVNLIRYVQCDYSSVETCTKPWVF